MMLYDDCLCLVALNQQQEFKEILRNFGSHETPNAGTDSSKYEVYSYLNEIVPIIQ